jgi:hypothetical protein
MTERRGRKVPVESQPSAAAARAHDDEVERALGRTVTLVLPIASIGIAVAVGALAGVGSALLVIAAGALIGAIGLFWASVRTLSGDAPLTVAFETLSLEQRRGNDELEEEKGRLLRALKDLENEHEIGKINDVDYQAFVARYRDEAKLVMRKMDVEVAPFRAEAERVAREYLAKRGLAGTAGTTGETPDPKVAGVARDERLTCTGCATSNEPDATFCKQCGSAMRKEHDGARA